MAQVTLRDLSTNEDIIVPPEGYIFGRVGGDADIQLEDNSISRRQARVSLKGGQWLLETLAVPQGQRAPRPIALEEGATFNVGQSEFEVVQVEEEEPAPTPPPPPKAKPGAPAPAPAKKPTASQTKAAPPQKKPTATNAPSGQQGFDVGAMVGAVPKGIAYYLLNAPKMLVNPIGHVSRAIDEQPHEPLGRFSLVGYSVPSMVVAVLLPAWATGIALLIGPAHQFSFFSFVPIPQFVAAIVLSVVSGLFWHPVWGWVLEKFGGSSDERSRTNFFLTSMTAAILMAVPSALGILLSPVPYVGVLLPPLLSTFATLVTLYVTYKWLEFFQVVKAVRTVVLVLGALSVLFALFGLAVGVKTVVTGGGSVMVPSTPGVATTDDGAPADGVEDETPPTDPEELQAWTEKRAAAARAKAEAAAAAIAAGKGGEAPDDAPPGDEKPTTVAARVEPKPDSKTPDSRTPDSRTPDSKTPEPKTPEPKPVEVKATDAQPAPQPAVEPAPPQPVAAPAPTGAYATFARRRDQVEKIFESDPTVLQKSRELQLLYGDYLKIAYELDTKWGKETAKKRENAKLYARLRDAELFTRTNKTVELMAERLKVR